MFKLGSLMTVNGTLAIYKVKEDMYNPYHLYMEFVYVDDKHSYPTKHKKLIAKYGNLASCTSYIHDYVMKNDIY